MEKLLIALAFAGMMMVAPAQEAKADPPSVPKKAKVEVIVGARAIFVKITLPTGDVIVREVKK